MNESTSHGQPLRRPTTDFATVATVPPIRPATAKVHDINYILGPSSDKPPPPRPEVTLPNTPASISRPEINPNAAALLTNFPTQRQFDQDGHPIQLTPTTRRISKAKKGKKVHVCEFGCGKVFTRAEHRKRHEANHRPEPLYKCHVESCNKPFQRLDLLNRHLERQHGIGPTTAESASAESKAAVGQMPPPPKRPHSSTASGKNDWNTYKDTIERLYITENKPLKDIKVHMEENYGFTPVEDRAYEKAFRRLGLSKNIPSTTMEVILQIIDQRRDLGKDTTVFWRNKRVDEKRIHRFRQRLARESKVEPSEILAQGRTFELPEHVRCETPNSSVNNSGAANIISRVHSPAFSDDGSGEDSQSDDDGDERPVKRLPCTSCGQQFSHVSQLRKHEEQHTTHPVQFDCPAPQCWERGGVAFDSHERLWRHMLEEHQMR